MFRIAVKVLSFLGCRCKCHSPEQQHSGQDRLSQQGAAQHYHGHHPALNPCPAVLPLHVLGVTGRCSAAVPPGRRRLPPRASTPPRRDYCSFFLIRRHPLFCSLFPGGHCCITHTHTHRHTHRHTDTRLSIRPSICLSVCLSVWLAGWLAGWLAVYLSIYVSIYILIYLICLLCHYYYKVNACFIL